MSDGGYLEVKNWREFQHYKDRDPLWIKLYRSVLTDYRFCQLPDASKLLAICIWLLASEDKEHKGRVPNDPEWIARRASLSGPIDLQVLIDAGFLTLERRKQPASRPLAKRLPRDRDRDRTSGEPKTTWLTPFWNAWQERCGEPPVGKLTAVLGPLVKAHPADEVLARWVRYLGATEPRYCSVHRFAETFHSWAGPATLEMTDDYGQMRLHTQRDGWWGYDDNGQWVRTIEVSKVSA